MLKILLAVALSLIVIIIAASLFFLNSSGISAVVGLPMLAVGAVVLLLVLLGGISVLFASYQIHDKTQALALPEGSIRAVIALMLIVLFAVLSIYLFGSLSEGRMVELGTVSAAEKAGVERLYDEKELLAIPVDVEQKDFKVWLKQRPSDAGIDFAKQLLVLVGTLVTSIASFYFGAKAASSTAPASETREVKDAPRIDAVQPAAVTRGTGGIGFTVTGKNLQRISTVRLLNGQREIDVTGLKTDPDRLTFTAVIPADVDVGKWDLRLVDSGGNSHVRTGVLDVN